MKKTGADYDSIMKELRAKTSAKNVAGMARFGIRPDAKVLGISIPVLRKKAKEIGKDHDLALKLWESGVHEARLLACFIDDPDEMTEEQIDSWAGDFDSWDVCDQCASALIDKTVFAKRKVFEWATMHEEFVKRAAFALIAAMAVHDKEAPDEQFAQYMPLIIGASEDDRNFVKKAVNWALRQIGKRNKKLNMLAIKTAEEIQRMPSRSAKWIAADAIRELKSDSVRKKLEAAQKKKRG